MIEFVGSLVSIALFFAIIYAFVKAAVAPIHEKLDRMLALQLASQSTLANDPADAGAS